MSKGYWVALVNVKNKEEYQKALGYFNDNNSERLFISLMDWIKIFHHKLA